MAKLKFNVDTPVYTSDATPWRMEQLPQVLDRLYAAGKPVVVFVHGRGKEPNKSLKGASFTQGLAVAKIELGYNASVLMFNWDSAFPGLSFLDRSRPLGNAPAGAKSLVLLLAGIKSYRQTHPAHPDPVLLVHSMGSIVVQHAVQDGLWPAGEAVFRRVVFSQPDADDVDHAVWLDRLAAQEPVFVTMNNDDHVLRHSNNARPAGRHALGLGTMQPLAAHARDIDLTGMGAVGSGEDKDHEVFGKGAMNGQVYVCQFFEQALKGADVVLDTDTNVESIERGVVYRIKAKFDPSAPCLKLPKL